MMILVRGNRVVASAEAITYGAFDEPIEKWALLDADGKVIMYYLDNGFTLVENVELPEDFEPDKYFYENGEFVLNEEWEPYVPEETLVQRIAHLEEQLANLSGEAVWDEMALAIEQGVNEVE